MGSDRAKLIAVLPPEADKLVDICQYHDVVLLACEAGVWRLDRAELDGDRWEAVQIVALSLGRGETVSAVSAGPESHPIGPKAPPGPVSWVLPRPRRKRLFKLAPKNFHDFWTESYVPRGT